MRDCKFKRAGKCGGHNSAGLGAITHCLVCWLAKDRAAAEAAVKAQEQRAGKAQRRLDRLKAEFRDAGRACLR